MQTIDAGYLTDSIHTVLNNLDKLPDKAIDELYFRVYAEMQERELALYAEFEEVSE